MRASSRSRLIPTSRALRAVACCCRWVCVGCGAYGSTRNAHYCYTRVTTADTAGVEADLDVLDEHGAVLLAVQGLRLGTGLSEDARRDRVLNERLLTIEWQQRELPEVRDTDGGTWLLISTSASADALATKLTDALKLRRRGVHHDGMAAARRPSEPTPKSLSRSLIAGEFQRCGGADRAAERQPGEGSALRGGEYVHHLVRIARELPEIAGEPPRLYVRDQERRRPVVHGDLANLEQAGLRGLMRVIGTEHPHLRATQIDLDDEHRCRAAGAATARRIRRGRDRLAERRVVHRAVVPESAAPRGAAHHRRRPRHATACACRSARPVISSRWNWWRSTGFRRGRARSRSRSPRPASTSPTSWSRSAGTRASRGTCRSWARISPAW